MNEFDKDRPANPWRAGLYQGKHAYVHEFGRELVRFMDPKPGERILDLGCGTGELTRMIAEAAGWAAGLDSSREMIGRARELHPGLEFILGDARDFRFEEPFDAVFSNAALHWIPEAETVAARVFEALRPGGRFAAELGGHGNVGRMESALRDALRRRGFAEAADRKVFYFPKLGEYAALLEAAGFDVVYAILFDRPTRLEDGGAGLRNWYDMFAGPFLQGIAQTDREAIVSEIADELRPVLFREGAWRADYRRLRIMAWKR